MAKTVIISCADCGSVNLEYGVCEDDDSKCYIKCSDCGGYKFNLYQIKSKADGDAKTIFG